MDRLVRTDARGRGVLPGHPDEVFSVWENDDGSVLLQPVRAVDGPQSDAQAEHDHTPELQELLARAAASPTRPRRRGRV